MHIVLKKTLVKQKNFRKFIETEFEHGSYIHKIQKHQMEEDNRNITEINALKVTGRQDKLWYSFSPQMIHITNFRGLRKKDKN